MSISIKVDGRPLIALAARAKEAFGRRGVLMAIALRQISWITLNFDRSGALVGGWQPLSPNTIAGRRQGSSRILQDTGHLKESFDINKSEGAFEMGDNWVTVGTNVQYAAAHQEGVSAASMNPILPKTARQYVGRNAKGHAIFKGGVLRFMTPRGPVFVTSVRNHPGIPQRRMLPTMQEASAMSVKVVEKIVEKATREGK